MSGEHVFLREPLTPIDADAIRYEVTDEDPTTWERPWTAVTTWTRSQNKSFEFACHEGNHSLDILRGARAEERAATGR